MMEMPVPSEAHYFSLLVGLGALLIGIAAVLLPQKMSLKFGIAAQGPMLPYVVSTGIRDVFMGLVVLVLFFRGEWIPLGFVNLFLGLVAACDFWVVNKHGDKKVARVHALGFVIVVIYGAWLLLSNCG
jgi:hypothetical protein